MKTPVVSYAVIGLCLLLHLTDQRYYMAITGAPLDVATFFPAHILTMNSTLASFSHVDDGHVYGNLLVFFTFSISLEQLLGSPKFVLLMAAIIVGENTVTFLGYRAFSSYDFDKTGVRVLGLSGVGHSVMTIMSVKYGSRPLDFIIILSLPGLYAVLAFLVWNTHSSPEASFLRHLSGLVVGLILGRVCPNKSAEEIEKARWTFGFSLKSEDAESAPKRHKGYKEHKLSTKRKRAML